MKGREIFVRNTEKYSECVDDIRRLLRDNDDIIVIPGAEVLHMYYDGKPIGTAKNKSWGKYPTNYNDYFIKSGCKELEGVHKEILSSKDKKSIYLDKKKIALIKKGIEKGLARDKERKSQQVIALEPMHQTFDYDKYSVCGMETTVPKEMIKNTNRNGGKQAEIDLVAVCPQKREILLIEYKCTSDATVNGITLSDQVWNFEVTEKKETKNIVAHCKDYLAILEMDRIEEFVIGILRAFNFMAQIKEKEMIDITEKELLNEYINNMRILFLLTNEPKKGCECKKPIVEGTYKTIKKYMKRLFETYTTCVIPDLTEEATMQEKFRRNAERIRFYAEKIPESVNLNKEFVTLEQLRYQK